MKTKSNKPAIYINQKKTAIINQKRRNRDKIINIIDKPKYTQKSQQSNS